MAPLTPGSIQTCGTATCNIIAHTAGSSVASESGSAVNRSGLGPLIVANAANEANKARLEATRQHLKLPPAQLKLKKSGAGHTFDHQHTSGPRTWQWTSGRYTDHGFLGGGAVKQKFKA
ncbi:hypothetical protein B0H14DRAFT_2587754 [Mycena olivaceomarginata]|nr:hypothetical protein B0H14DRAFT_2587754 [Mycena olivaceomarginata]